MNKELEKKITDGLFDENNYCSYCGQIYYLEELKQFLCQRDNKQVRPETPACSEFEESVWRTYFKKLVLKYKK